MYQWYNCPLEIKQTINSWVNEIKNILKDNYIGTYLHGSLAMGGFHPDTSDVDLIVVNIQPLKLEEKQQLATFFLEASKTPYPIEISLIMQKTLINWQHPCPYEFHYSEYWRQTYETIGVPTTVKQVDPDLAAHLTITYQRGICLDGKPINDVIPVVPKEHYIQAIISDYNDCFDLIEERPIYSILNMLRVYWFLIEGIISSKEEAGIWGMKQIPLPFSQTVTKAVKQYQGMSEATFTQEELNQFKNYIQKETSKI